MPKPKNFKGKDWAGRKPGSYQWYEVQDSIDYYQEFEKPKIIYQVFQVTPCFIWDERNHYCNNAIWIIPRNDKVLLAILNSPLGWYLISRYCTQIQNGFQLIFKYLEKIPIKEISNEREKKVSAEIIRLVDLLLQLNKDIQTEKLPANIEQIKTRIAHSEEKIDQLVYELYQLTPEEIKIVEGGSHE